jgi:hypothetical protein
MNADFVLADGSLRSVLKQITAGRSIVLAPSFRVMADVVEPQLRDAVDPHSGALVMSPRQLVSLALKHPHQTMVAKTVTQQTFHSTRPNQFFWKVDEQTVLGRYYLIFMLCLKPERILPKINSYCDYGFIPEMCPSADEAVMGDSDDFFMLELQQHDYEWQFLQQGSLSEIEVSRSLSAWTTAEHRRTARYDVVFHAGEIPPRMNSLKAEASVFINRIGEMLGPPMRHAHHPYWSETAETYRTLLEARGLPALPSEIDVSRLHSPWRRHLQRLILNRLAFRSLVSAAHRLIMGHPPVVTPLHPNWLDYLHLREALRGILNVPDALVLVVREDPGLIDGLIEPDSPVRFSTLDEVLSGHVWKVGNALGPYSDVVIYLRIKDLRHMRVLAEHLAHTIRPGGTSHVFIENAYPSVEDNDFSQLFKDSDNIVLWSASFLGSSLRHFNRQLFTRLSADYLRSGKRAMLWVIPALAIGLPLVLVTNFVMRRTLPYNHFVRHWTSALIRVGVPAGTQFKDVQR